MERVLRACVSRSRNRTGSRGPALELLRDLPKLKKVVMNPPDNQPTLSIDESAELSDWPECTRPLSGFVFIEK